MAPTMLAPGNGYQHPVTAGSAAAMYYAPNVPHQIASQPPQHPQLPLRNEMLPPPPSYLQMSVGTAVHHQQFDQFPYHYVPYYYPNGCGAAPSLVGTGNHPQRVSAAGGGPAAATAILYGAFPMGAGGGAAFQYAYASSPSGAPNTNGGYSSTANAKNAPATLQYCNPAGSSMICYSYLPAAAAPAAGGSSPAPTTMMYAPPSMMHYHTGGTAMFDHHQSAMIYQTAAPSAV